MYIHVHNISFKMTRQDKMIYLTQLSFTRHIGYRYTFTIQTETPDTQDVKYYALLMLQIEADRLTGRQSCETMTPDQAELDFRRNNPDLILVLILRLKFLLKRWYISLLIKVKKKKQEANKLFFKRRPAESEIMPSRVCTLLRSTKVFFKNSPDRKQTEVT